MSAPLAGAWALISDTHEGLMVCTESHYSMTISEKNRPRIVEPTNEEILASYQAVNANAGTYETSGSTLRFERRACLRVNRINEPWVGIFTVEGDLLTMRSISGDGRAEEIQWSRIG